MTTPRSTPTGPAKVRRHRPCWLLLSDGTAIPISGNTIIIPGGECLVTDDPALLTPWPDGTDVQGFGAITVAGGAGANGGGPPTGSGIGPDNATGGGGHPARAGP